MEKQNVIQELHRLQDLWNNIIPLTEKSIKTAFSKGETEERRKKESEATYRYNPKIKIPNELSTSNAAEVESKIAFRHKQDCLNAAKKKMSVVRVLMMLATIFGIIFTVVPHISNIIGDELSVYDSFTESIGFTLRDDVAEYQSVISTVLALFSAGSQALTVLLAGIAASSIIKAKACSRVPEFGTAHKGLSIAAFLFLGIFGIFTWITVNPTGILAIAPIFVLMLILKAVVSKLKESAHPLPTADEYDLLEKAKAEDIKNREANDVARKEANAKDKKLFETRQKKYIADCDKEISEYEEQIEQLTDDIAAFTKQTKSEVISNKDNNLDTINRLLNYLENGRADTLKEALHMVDMDREREKDRETQKQIARMKLENDRFMAELDRQEAKRYNDQLLAQQRAHNERVQREQDRHNAQMEREQEAHNREMMKELEKIKNNRK